MAVCQDLSFEDQVMLCMSYANRNYNGKIPMELIEIIQSFWSDRSTVFKWNLLKDMIDINKLKKMQFGEFIDSKPNGWNEHDFTKGSCLLRLHLKHLPKEWDNVTAYYYIYCEETGSMVECIIIFNRPKMHWGWRQDALLNSELQLLHSINIQCKVKILEIRNKKNELIYEYPLPINQICNKHQIVWIVDDILLQKFKSCRNGKSYQPLNNSNELFTLSVSPNGARAIDEGFISMFIYLRALPSGIKKIKFKFNMKITQIETEKSTVTTTQYGVKKTKGVFRLCSNKIFSRYFKIEFIVDIEILNVWNGNNQKINNPTYKNVNARD
eukprot:240385_1